MPQNSLTLPTSGTVSGLQMTQNINSALDTLVSVNSGASAPGTTYAYMMWADTSAGLLKQRNAANSGWVVRGSLAETRTVARSSNTALGVGDFGKTFVASNTFTQTFNASSTLGDGWQCVYVNSGNGVITFDPASSETIDGLATVALAPGEGCVLTCDGNNLFSAGRSVSMRQNQTGTAFTTTGTAPAFNVASSPLFGALATNQRMALKFHSAGNGTNTLSRDGTTVANLKQYDSAGNKVTATITANLVTDVVYDGIDYIVLDAVPPAAASTVTTKVVTTTRDIATANGTQDVTGFGFNPSAVTVMAVVNGTSKQSFGMVDSSATQQAQGHVTGAHTVYVGSSTAIYLDDNVGNSSSGVISFITDGVRITWTKTSSPTGTATINIMGFK